MEQMYDVIVVGGGPAGLTAALYLARASYRVLVLEQAHFGGQIAITDEVVNYPGVARTSGQALTDTMRAQAASFGAEFLTAQAQSYDLTGDIKTVHTDVGDKRCLGVILATGARPRTIGFRGEETYKGRGVAYCATCDGEFFTGKEIFVVGGGYAAAEESVFLTKFATHVTILIRKDDFSCARSLAEQARRHEKITVLTNTVLEEVAGEDALTYVRYRNTVTGEITEHRDENGFGVFVLAGYAPDTQNLQGVVERNEQGYIITDAAQKTSVDGVYAAGDVCIKPLRQVVTATADGALAATQLEKYVAQMQRKTGIYPKRPDPPRETAPRGSAEGALFDADMREQLRGLFSKMEQTLLLKLYLDERPISRELSKLVGQLCEMSDRLHVQTIESHAQAETPCVRVCLSDGTDTGLAFHGVPGGHEFGSFVMGLYHVAGAGSSLDDATKARIDAISKKTDLKILVTLSCTMCPETVKAAQQIAACNANVTAQVYDIAHFDALRERYRVMSVPCLIVNDESVYFGKKNLAQVLALLEDASQA